MGGIQAADLSWSHTCPPVFTRLSERSAGETRKTLPRIYFKFTWQAVTRGAGAAPDPPSKTYRGHWAGVRAPWAGVRVAFVMTIWEGFSNCHKACHFLKCMFTTVNRGTRGTQSRSASLLARSTSPGPRSAKRGAALASGYKVHVSYKQHSGETISMFHVEQKVVKKG